MKLLFDDKGAVVVRNGAPVYVKDDGREIEFDGAKAFEKIGQLTGENTTFRRKFEEAETKLKSFEDLDPEVARKALQTVKNIDDKKLVDAGKVEEVRAAAVQAYEDKLQAASKSHATQLQELTAKLEKATGELFSEKIGGSFTRSKLIQERFAVPADLVQAKFGSAFKVEDGRIVAYDSSGNKIYSPSRAGELADFDEALDVLVSQYPHKEHILKGSGASGGGANGGGAAGGNSMTREQFSAMKPADRAAAMAKKVQVVD